MQTLKTLIEVLQMYEVGQKERYNKVNRKEKGSDLVLLFDLLTNALDERYRVVNLSTGLCFHFAFFFTCKNFR